MAPSDRSPLLAPGPPRVWKIRGQQLTGAAEPWIMGIVNVTPDSFSDGGQFVDSSRSAAHALQLVQEGAAIIDVGGESTRPGAEPVGAGEELRRVIPVIRTIAEQSAAWISIDTTKAQVAREAIAAGAHIVNDVSGLTFDAGMPAVCAETRAGVVCMHIQGTPRTMQLNPAYADVVSEIAEYLSDRIGALERQGVSREQVAVDPGIGFGKSAEHNLTILSNVARFRELGRPVCIGHSRKRFLKKLLGREVDERLCGTIGVAVALALQGTEIIRVHDVAPVRDAILACRAVLAPRHCRS